MSSTSSMYVDYDLSDDVVAIVLARGLSTLPAMPTRPGGDRPVDVSGRASAAACASSSPTTAGIDPNRTLNSGIAKT